MRFPFPILLETEDLVVLDKPSGLVVHRGFSGDRDSVVDRLAAAGYRGLHTVHRLDRGTSGALVLAKHVAAARALSADFAESRVAKTYLALVRGVCPDEMDVDHAIPSDEDGPRVPAQTHIRRLGWVETSSKLREPRYSLVRATPRNGRFHQVRRHLAHLRHPLVGDTTYGKSEHNHYCRDVFGLARLCLHAETLGLPVRPGSADLLRVSCPLPADLALGLARMGFDNLLDEPPPPLS